MEEYGFIYIWFDRKKKMYYIGRRWGNINDGYVCSSKWLLSAMEQRPDDFKRRIIKTNIKTKNQLRKEEHKYLSLIESHEFGVRYYNLKNNALGYRPIDSYNGHTEETKKKISETKKKNPTKFWEGKKRSSETKKKISETKKKNPHIQTEEQRKINSEKVKALWQDPIWRNKVMETRRKNKSANV